MTEMNSDTHQQEDILNWTECACWMAVLLTPLLQWVNGPSVSTDQAVVRTALVVIATTGAIVLRVVNSRRKKQKANCGIGKMHERVTGTKVPD